MFTGEAKIYTDVYISRESGEWWISNVDIWVGTSERKVKCRGDDASSEKAMKTKQAFKKGPKCHHCGKYGHIRRNCRKFAQEKKSESNEKDRTRSVKYQLG